MKKIVWAVFAAMATISSCQVEEPYNDEALCDNDIFYAAICDEGSSKTVMDENNNIRWSAGDQLIIFKKTSLGLKYQIQDAYVGETSGYFSKVVSASGSDDFGAGMSIDHNIAYYPYASDVKFAKSGNDYTLKVALPSEQTYASESFGNGSFPMAAVSSDTDLTFKNVCGGIKLQLKGTCKVGSIVIEGNNGEKLSGTAVVTVYADEEAVPSITMAADASTSVTLNCGDGVHLNETTATEFIISLPPTTFTKGFAITVTDTDGGTQTIETSKENEVLRSSLLKMPEVKVETRKNLSVEGSANCYIVSKAGTYQFTPFKGNTYESVGDIASVEVLWESFGTDVAPHVGELVNNATYSDGYINFNTPSPYREGNAVIAAKDISGTILWSWHIWLTDAPEEQEYYNNAGVLMDRNLGATSATPGDVCALGLHYQWGRKDPFLGSASISSNTIAKSTITWPSAESSDASVGTIEYAITNPTTFIKYNTNNWDWYYSDLPQTDNTRWTETTSPKSVYDPCPAGWRVPDGGSQGVWSKALGVSSSFENPDMFDMVNKGIDFSGKLGSATTIWYPASDVRSSSDGTFWYVGRKGRYCSTSPIYQFDFLLHIAEDGVVDPFGTGNRADGASVRCIKESSIVPSPVVPELVDLSKSGTANSYIVSEAGSYRFNPTKGNSSEPVGSIASAEVLWETFGTDVTPNVGDLVKNVKYENGLIAFETPSTFGEGNAVIAAKDASGTILWSWHIWLTDQPEGQVYYNNAGTMMDRNLGATSATPGDVGALGLFYQWGRKDPFLGSSSISDGVVAKSTIVWPSAVLSNSSNGTIEFATANPTTFITYNTYNSDWYYTGSSSTDNTRWTISGSAKSIYDPCPAAWRVPDGGSNGVWSKALNSSVDDSIRGKGGYNFSDVFGAASTIWYPGAGSLSHLDGSLTLASVCYRGYYWSASPNSDDAYRLHFYYGSTSYYYSDVYLSDYHYRASGHSVRCIKE